MMTKNLLKIIGLLTLMAIPKNISEGYNPRLKEINDEIQKEIIETNLKIHRYHLIEINENISSLERKKDFVQMRLDKGKTDSTIKENYLKILKETEKEIRGYYHQKDSIYKLIKK